MNKFFQLSFVAVALVSAVVLVSCGEDDPPLPDNVAAFQADTQGLASSETEATVNITLVRAVETAGNLTISYTATGLTYGDDFTTDPAPDANNKIVIPVAVGATEASFKVTKTNTTGLEGTEKVVFTIATVAEGLVLNSTKSTFTLSFSEIIATNSEMQINGGGTNAQNRVFIDLSGNRQTPVARSTWDLAFTTAADKFRVVLNSSNKMLAYKLDKNDLTAVNADDTVGLGAKVSAEAIFGIVGALPPGTPPPDWVAGSTAWMDDRSGDLSKTAIAEISATDAENSVYIINRGTNADLSYIGWLKVRVLRDGDTYIVQYADIDSETFTEKNVEKNSTHSFTYFSFTTGSEVEVEPGAEDWDFAWTGFTNITTFDGAVYFPYYNLDVIITNIHGGAKAFTYYTTQAAPAPPGVTYTGDETYETFTEADLAVITNYSTSQLAIGTTWRSLPQSGSPSINDTRFHIVQDADGNVYKVKFTKVITASDERGKPEFKFELLKKGS